MINKTFPLLVVLFTFFLILGCATTNAPAPTPATVPTVTAVSPASGSADSLPQTTIKATFSISMDATTITATTFQVASGTSVSGTVSYDPATKTATFTPATRLNNLVTYTATISAGAKSFDGASMAAAHTWQFSTGDVLFYLTGPAVSQFGHAVSYAGDVNGDGKTDLIVGSHSESGGGAAYVYSGADGSQLYRKAGGASGDIFGWSVGSTGSQVLVGSSGYDPGSLAAAGAVYIYTGASGTQVNKIVGADVNVAIGFSVSNAGDVNGDGNSDFVIGGNDHAYVYLSGGTLHQQFAAETPNDKFGWSVSYITDVNGDGKSDILVGAPARLTTTGAVYLYSGFNGALIRRIDNPTASTDEMFGTSVCSVGDKIIIGAPNASPGGSRYIGSVYVYSSTGSQLHQFNGEAAGDEFGTAVANAGDFNGDGTDDILIGAYKTDSTSGVSHAGTFYIYSGTDYSLLLKKQEAIAGAYTGGSLSTAGDLNGDGKSEILVGSWGFNLARVFVGR